MSAPSATPTTQQTTNTITIDDDEPIQRFRHDNVNESRIADRLFHPIIGEHRRCMTCDTSIKQVKSNKTGLVNHLKAKHAAIWSDAIDTVRMGSAPSSVAGSGQQRIDDDEGLGGLIRQDRFDDACLRWIVKDQQAFSVVEHEDFRAMIWTINRRIEFISAATMSRRIINYHLKFEQIIRTKIEAIPGKYSCTTDIWTSTSGMPYMAVTMHWLDNNWDHCTLLIGFESFDSRHSGIALGKLFMRIMRPYYGADEKLKNRLLAVVTDNASNNEGLIQYLLEVEALADKECHVRCFAHCINLAATDALKCIKSSIENLRTLIKAIKYRRELIRILERECQAENRPDGAPALPFKKPFLNVKTRWNSTYHMLDYALQYRDPLERCQYEIMQLKGRDRLTVLRADNDELKEVPFEPLTDDDWTQFADFRDFLAQFEEATVRCCADQSATLQTIVPWYNILMDHCDKTVEEENEESTLHDAAEEAKDKLIKYYDISSEHMTIAVLLDPRQRTAFYTDDIEDEEEIRATTVELEKQLRKSYNTYKAAENTPPVPITTSSNPVFKKRKIERASDEVRSYLFEIASANFDEDPVSWWKSSHQRFPVLSKMARDYLAIPSSSASSERAFSRAGLLITDRRTRLGTNAVRACCLLQSWMCEDMIW